MNETTSAPRSGRRRPRCGGHGLDGRRLAEVGTYEPLRAVLGRGGDPALTARAWSLMSDLVR